MSTYLPEVVVDNPWLFEGIVAGAVGLSCAYLIRKWGKNVGVEHAVGKAEMKDPFH